MSATALLQKAAQVGATTTTNIVYSPMVQRGFGSSMEPSIFNDGVQVQSDHSQLAGVVSGFYYHHQNQNLSSGMDLQKLAGNNKEMRRDDSLTVDFLGIGGVGGRSFDELQHQEMGLENQAVSQQRMQGLSTVWDV